MDNLIELKEAADNLLKDAKNLAETEENTLTAGEKAIFTLLESLHLQNQAIIKLLKDLRSPTNIF